MFNFLKKKLKKIKENVVEPPGEVIFADPNIPAEVFKMSDTIDKFIKNINPNKDV